MTDLASLDSVERLKAAMLAMPQWEPDETGHLFYAGHYMRALFRPAGVAIVGKRHKKPHLYLLVKGTIKIGRRVYTAPHLIQCAPGTQRAVIALTDALCVTFHETEATDVETAEADLVEPDPDSPFLPGNRLPLKELT